MTILNFALKIKGVGRDGGTCEVLRPCHPPPKKKIWNVHLRSYVLNCSYQEDCEAVVLTDMGTIAN